MNKSFFIASVVISLIFVFPFSASAQETVTTDVITVEQTTTSISPAAKSPRVQPQVRVNGRPQELDNASTTVSDRSTSQQERVIAAIDRRIAALNILLRKIQGFKLVSDQQKTALAQDVQLEIDTLTNLKTQISGETDPANLRTLIDSFVTSFRTYALYIPKISVIAAADAIYNISDILSGLHARLSLQVQEAEASGHDVTQLTESLDSMETAINNAKTQADNAVNTVVPLEPEGFPTNKTTIRTARTSLVNARAFLLSARQEAQNVVEGLRAVKAMTPGSTSSHSAEITSPSTQ